MIDQTAYTGRVVEVVTDTTLGDCTLADVFGKLEFGGWEKSERRLQMLFLVFSVEVTLKSDSMTPAAPSLMV